MTSQPPLGATPTGLPGPPVGHRPERMPDRYPLPANSRPNGGSTASIRTRSRDRAASGTWNERADRDGDTFLAGVSYAWWMNKHTRHHGNPSAVGKGPDIAFAPNHKGMPIIEEGQKVDFFSRQVLTSRNSHGGRWIEHFMGSLNYQVEHHLVPNMLRPNLRAARLVVQQFCTEHDVPPTETSLIRSYVIVVQYLNRVGLAARDPFPCPIVQHYRIR